MGVFLLALVGSLAFLMQRVQAHNQRVAVAQREFDKYAAAKKLRDDLSPKFDALEKRLADDYRAASRASARRHDGVVAGTLSDEQYAQLTKAEETNVEALSQDIDDVENLTDRWTAIFSNLYGEDATKQVTSDQREWTENMRQVVTPWSRAIAELHDEAQETLNGVDGQDMSTEAVSNLYEQSDEAGIRAKRISARLDDDSIKLRDRLLKDVKRTKLALEQAEKS